jgi:hypothetical protein
MLCQRSFWVGILAYKGWGGVKGCVLWTGGRRDVERIKETGGVA